MFPGGRGWGGGDASSAAAAAKRLVFVMLLQYILSLFHLDKEVNIWSYARSLPSFFVLLISLIKKKISCRSDLSRGGKSTQILYRYSTIIKKTCL